MPAIESMATAATATPKRPAMAEHISMAATITATGISVDCMPTARPAMMLVACPPSLALAIWETKGEPSPV